jgi:hypothetical protein
MDADPIRADCHTDYKAYRNSGVRDTKTILWIVMHSTEGGTAKSVAQYFTTKNAGGSAHLVVDDTACYRCLLNETVAWGAPGANTKGFHIEQVGYAKWTAREWRDHIHTLERAAFKAAFHCHKFGLPPKFVDAAGLKAKTPGITTHAECTKAFGGDHTDPGPGWPRAMFLALVQKYWRELEGPPV